jgi:hypothetical protein
MALGAFIFLALPLTAIPALSTGASWSLSEAMAGEPIMVRPEILQADVAAAHSGPILTEFLSPTPASQPAWRKHTDIAVLGLTFSLLVAFNLAFVRHLRQVAQGRSRRPLLQNRSSR